MRWFIFIMLFFSLVLGIFIWGSGTNVPQAAREGFQQIQSILPAAETRFLVVGDNHGLNPIYEAALARAKSEGVDFILNLADLTEHGTDQEFAEVDAFERRFGIPVYHTIGNHDIQTDETGALYTKRFHPRWYSKDIGSVHLIVLDNSDRKVGFSPTQLEWLERDLSTTREGVTIIAFHRPFGFPLADLTGDDETSASRRSNDAFRAILRKHHVTRIFTAHIHTHASYSMEGVPVEISGGGGDPAQALLGGPEHSFFHAILATAKGDELKSQVLPLSATTDPS